MKGVIDGIIKTEHISLNRTAGFGWGDVLANSSLEYTYKHTHRYKVDKATKAL